MMRDDGMPRTGGMEEYRGPTNRVSVSPQQPPPNGTLSGGVSDSSQTSAPSHAATVPARPVSHVSLLRCSQMIVIPILVLMLSGRISQQQHWPFRSPPGRANGPTPLTLRQVFADETTGFHLAMAPAFFGFYGYLGLLAAVPTATEDWPVRSVVGASAGALVAMVVASDIAPATAMTFLSNVTVSDYADGPGWGAVFRGNRVEALLHQFLLSHAADPTSVRQMERTRIPVAVTAFDLTTLSTRILRTGAMARAARASATFPGLFQPVGLSDQAVLIDGGVQDPTGTLGLTETLNVAQSGNATRQQRVLQLCVGRCRRPPSLPGVEEWIAISVLGLPLVGPWNSQGPRAYEMARRAMHAALDVPLPMTSRKQFPIRYHLTLRA